MRRSDPHYIALLLLLSLVLVAPCSAADESFSFTGNDLLRTCDGPYPNKLDELGSTRFCLGYIQGMHQFQQAIRAIREVNPLFCEPRGGTYDQLRRVLVKWLKDNPEKLHHDAQLTAVLAFSQAFPCP